MSLKGKKEKGRMNERKKKRKWGVFYYTKMNEFNEEITK